jgi:hypothetical protein
MKLTSPHAEKIRNYLLTQPDWVTPLHNCHERAHMSIGDFERGLSWLSHFGYIRESVEHGRVLLELLK